jgi:hypothetical protein
MINKAVKEATRTCSACGRVAAYQVKKPASSTNASTADTGSKKRAE